MYWYVLEHEFQRQPYFVGAMTWYKGVHHQLYHIMKCHDIVHTDIYLPVQVFRILREMAVY